MQKDFNHVLIGAQPNHCYANDPLLAMTAHKKKVEESFPKRPGILASVLHGRVCSALEQVSYHLFLAFGDGVEKTLKRQRHGVWDGGTGLQSALVLIVITLMAAKCIASMMTCYYSDNLKAGVEVLRTEKACKLT